MEFLLGHHTTKIIIVIIVLIFSNSFACSAETNLNITNKSKTLSLKAEQAFWNEWIYAQKDSSCPLQPFISNRTIKEIEKIDKKISKLTKYKYAILFVRVNIDNGITEVVYIATACKNSSFNYYFWDVLNKKHKYEKINYDNINVCQLINHVNKYDTYVDIENKMILDSDSVYLTVINKGAFSRFASYNSKVDNNNEQFNLPILHLRKYLDGLKRKSVSKANQK